MKVNHFIKAGKGWESGIKNEAKESNSGVLFFEKQN
jgi:hypothetical protein